MKRRLVSLVALIAVAGSLAISLPAEAGHRDWVVGTAFRIGHLSFHLTFRDFDHDRPNYYYRTGGQFRESRHRCTDRCFREGHYTFHDARCPRILGHFDDHRYNPYAVFERYAPRPRHDGYSNQHRRHDRHLERRDDRRDDSWRWRHHRHPRHRHHHHDNSCRHRH